MDDFIREIEAFAGARNIEPSTVLQKAVNASGLTWRGWKAGTLGCTVRTMDRVRAYMRAQPAPTESVDDLAEVPE